MPNPFRSDFVIGGAGRASAASRTPPVDSSRAARRSACSRCPPSACPSTGRGAYNLEIFQPASRYWLFQGIETLLFAGMAVVLLIGAIWWIRRRLT
jgi:hypothetical protein